jgi:hypothetical protein
MGDNDFIGWALHKNFKAQTASFATTADPVTTPIRDGQSVLVLHSKHGPEFNKHMTLTSDQDLLFTKAQTVLPSTSANIAMSHPTSALFPNNPNNPEELLAMANSLSVSGLAELWHQRLGHSSHEYVRSTRDKTYGIPKFKAPDDLHVCDSCAHGATHKASRNSQEAVKPTEPFQDIVADFGFFAPKTDIEKTNLTTTISTPTTLIEGQHGYKAYLLIIDRRTRYVWVFLTKDKSPPLEIMTSWFREFGNKRSTNNILRTDNGGELAGHEGFRKLCAANNYMVQSTAADASYQIGMVERPHRHAGEVVRKLLHNANLPARYWPYALLHWALLWNITSHRQIETTPYESVTGVRPNIARLRVFGCKVIVRRLGDRPNKVEYHVNEGYFLGYTATLDNILYHNIATSRMAKAPSATFDEACFTRTHLTPGGKRLAQATGRDPANFTSTTGPIDLNLEAVSDPYLEKIHIQLTVPETKKHGFQFVFEESCCRLYVTNALSRSPAATHLTKRKRIRHAWLLTVNGKRIRTESDINEAIKELDELDSTSTHISWIFAPDRARAKTRQSNESMPLLNLDQLTRVTKNLERTLNQSASTQEQEGTSDPEGIAHQPLDDFHPMDLLQPMDLHDDASIMSLASDGTYERTEANQPPDHRAPDHYEPFDCFEEETYQAMCLAVRLQTTLQLQKAKRLTRRRLMQQDDWPEWCKAEFKMLDQYAAVNMYGTPIQRAELSPDTTILKSLWCYVLKADGRRKARNVCNGQPSRCRSKANKKKITIADTYAASLSQVELRLYWALTARRNWIAYGADATNAFAYSPPPKGNTVYMEVDDQYALWYNAKHPDNPIDGSFVLPVQHALQGHPESPRLWEGHINAKLQEMGFKNSPHAPCLYYGLYDEEEVLILRQVDDFSISSEHAITAKAIYDDIHEYCSLIQEQGPVKLIYGIDILQSRHYIKVSLESYINTMIEEYPFLQNVPTTDRPSAPLTEETLRAMELASPPQGSGMKDKLQKEQGFNYRSLLGKLVFAMNCGRFDISFAISKLSQYNDNPCAIHYRALWDVAIYATHTKDKGLIYNIVKWMALPMCQRFEFRCYPFCHSSECSHPIHC